MPWRKLETDPAPIKLWVKVKRQIGKRKPEFESIGILRGNNLSWIVKTSFGVNGKSVTHWDYLE